MNGRGPKPSGGSDAAQLLKPIAIIDAQDFLESITSAPIRLNDPVSYDGVFGRDINACSRYRFISCGGLVFSRRTHHFYERCSQGRLRTRSHSPRCGPMKFETASLWDCGASVLRQRTPRIFRNPSFFGIHHFLESIKGLPIRLSDPASYDGVLSDSRRPTTYATRSSAAPRFLGFTTISTSCPSATRKRMRRSTE